MPSDDLAGALEAAVQSRDAEHFQHSQLREKILEHLFVGELLRQLWRRKRFDVEVLRSEFDAHGYDLVITRGSLVRHVQLKSGVQSKPGRIALSTNLERRGSGCAIWIGVQNDLTMARFYYLGARPGEPFTFGAMATAARRVGRTARGIRPLRGNHVIAPAAMWQEVNGIEGCIRALLG